MNFLCKLHFTPRLPQVHVKDPGHAAKWAGGRSRHSVGTYRGTGQEMLVHCCLTCSSAGQEMLVQLAGPLWTDSGLNSGISVCELISTCKKNQTQMRNDLLNLFLKYLPVRKKQHHHHAQCVYCVCVILAMFEDRVPALLLLIVKEGLLQQAYFGRMCFKKSDPYVTGMCGDSEECQQPDSSTKNWNFPSATRSQMRARG